MVVSIGKNLSSMQVARQLDTTSQRLSNTFERLSSGLRINRPSDDPAGLTVAGMLQLDTRVLNRARLNLSDATSVLNIADGALSVTSNILERMGELASQSANGVFSRTQRIALSREYQALDLELRRAAFSTTFNGKAVFNSGEFSSTEKILLNGDGAFNAASLAVTSDDGRYAEAGTGFPLSNVYVVRDLEAGGYKTIDLTSDPELGAMVSSDLLKVTDSGIAILQGRTAAGTHLYMYDLETDTRTRLTTGSTVDSYATDGVNVSADGSTLVFSSQTVYQDGAVAVNGGTSSASYRLYALDLETGVIRTNGETLNARTSQVAVSADGTQVAYKTTASSTLVYTVDTGSAMTGSSTLNSAIGYTLTNAGLAGINNSGEVLFTSTNDVLGNGNSVRQIFLANSDSGGVSQLTSFTSNAVIENMRTSADGSTVFFTSAGNLTGENSAARTQLFRFDVSIGELEQLSDFDGSDPVLSVIRTATTGKLIAIQSVPDDVALYTFTEDNVEFDFEAGFGAEGRILASIDSFRESLSLLASQSISSQSAAMDALTEIREGISAISDLRSRIGAGVSRLSAANRFVQGQADELERARGRIVDVDFALETADLTRLSIMQQASTALLAQTNLQTRIALRLISGADGF